MAFPSGRHTTSMPRLPAARDRPDMGSEKAKERVAMGDSVLPHGMRPPSTGPLDRSALEKAESGTDSETGERRKSGVVSLFAAMESKLDRRMPQSDPGIARKDRPSKPVSALSKELPAPPSSSSRSGSNSPSPSTRSGDSPVSDVVHQRYAPHPPSRPRPSSSSHSPSRPVATPSTSMTSPSPSPASSTQSSPSAPSFIGHAAAPGPSGVKRSTSDDWSASQKVEPSAGSPNLQRRRSVEQDQRIMTKDERARSSSGGGSTVTPSPSPAPASPVRPSSSGEKGNRIKEIWSATKNLIGGSSSSSSRHRSRDLSTSAPGHSHSDEGSPLTPSTSATFGGVSLPMQLAPAAPQPHLSDADEGESSGQDSTPSDKSAMEDTLIHHDVLLTPPSHRKAGFWRSVDDTAIEQVVSDDPRLFFAALLEPSLPEPEDVPLDLDLSDFIDVVYDKPLPPPPPAAAASAFESYSRPLPPLPPPPAAAPAAAPAREGLFNSKPYTQSTRKASVKRGEESRIHVSRAERRSAQLRRTASTDNIVAMGALLDFAAQVQPTPGFRIEAPNGSGGGAGRTGPADALVEDPEPVYAKYFVPRRHVNYIGFNNYIGYVAVSLVKEPGAYLALLRTKEADQKVLIPVKGLRKPSDRKLLQLVNAFLTTESLAKVPSADVELVKTLCDFDDLKVAKLKRTNSYKIGVLYVQDGQTRENEMFSNTVPSREFEDFLNFMGQRVVLQGFTQFNGGLDTEGESTGKYSVYTQWQNAEIMFHVSTLIPLGDRGSEENQLIERKRHIGNDVVVVVFTDSNSVPFNPRVMGSHYNHVFIVVSVDRGRAALGQVRYRISVVQREGVPPFQPPVAFPPLYERSAATRHFLLSKIVAGELASLHAPGFRSRIISSRQKLLQVLASKYPK